MYRTESQVKLQYFQAMSRITQMKALAEQMSRLANSYLAEDGNRVRTLRDASGGPAYEGGKGEPGNTLREQARELHTAADDWYRKAKAEYERALQEVDRAEGKRRSS